MKIHELQAILKRVKPDRDVSEVIQFSCGKCDGAGSQYNTALVSETTFAKRPPALSSPRGAHHVADREQIEGVPSNADFQSWCTHDDEHVTVETRAIITVPIELAKQLGTLSGTEQCEVILQHLGTPIFQIVGGIGFHCGEVEMCQRRGGWCPHREASS